MMKRMICGRKVLVVLDDVDHIDQLEALPYDSSWFKPGSRIIMTKRDEQVLVAHGVNLVQNVHMLSNNEGICLFSKYEFEREIPIKGCPGNTKNNSVNRNSEKNLELSYIGLEEDYKEIFLDVACILKGWLKYLAIKALQSYGFHARDVLRVLEQKSLITISHGGYLGMHNHIEEMRRNIVSSFAPR
ncbi:unnamed protein product [Lactuca saligna]|uniref:NB-ARC domain-containing protein n=1 Tax=Lactuca saligna TaxID=75948 RepID=A0AA36A2U7_LACSI|nr:unnamed protein product [Lactuca saligna]